MRSGLYPASELLVLCACKILREPLPPRLGVGCRLIPLRVPRSAPKEAVRDALVKIKSARTVAASAAVCRQNKALGCSAKPPTSTPETNPEATMTARRTLRLRSARHIRAAIQRGISTLRLERALRPRLSQRSTRLLARHRHPLTPADVWR